MSNYRDEFLEDTYYLVSNKGFSNNILFENSDDYKTFILYVISNLLEYPSISMSAYCILPEYFYFVVKNKEKGFKLSDFMRKIQVSYAMYFKKKNVENEKLKGVPVFEGRFIAQEIQNKELERTESCVSYEPLKNKLVEKIKNRPYTSAHQITDTGYDPMSQTHIKVYNDGRKIYKRFFD